MSRAYTVRVSKSVVEHRRIEDGIEAGLELLPIVGRERTSDLLTEALVDRGFVREGDVLTKTVDGVVIEITPGTGTVRVRAADDVVAEVVVDRSESAWDGTQADRREQLEVKVDAQIADEVEARVEVGRQALADRLEEALIAIKPELDAVSDVVNRAALREKAGQMGQILDVAEDPESGEMTIRVKV